MDQDMIGTHLTNLDRRLARVEQILPMLATKEELRAAIAPLATKDELKALATKEELRAAIAPLATREELREEGERSRRHMDVLIEGQREDIQILAEHLTVVMARLADR